MRRAPLLALAAIAALATPAAADYRVGDLTIQNPWSRPAMAGMNGAGFMTILNTGAKPVRLVSIESALAARTELHHSSMAGGVMTMRRLDDGAAIAPGGQLDLAPGGYHLMLIGLKQPLVAGQKAPITLVFDNGRRVAIDLTVQMTPPQPPKGAMSGHDHH